MKNKNIQKKLIHKYMNKKIIKTYENMSLKYLGSKNREYLLVIESVEDE